MRGFGNRRNDAVQILQNVAVDETQDSVTTTGEPRIAPCIGLLARFKIVTFAIQFDDNLRGMRNEIGNVSAHRRLPAKSKASETMRFELTPKQSLGASHCPSQSPCVAAVILRDTCVRHTPLPIPPPQGGREHQAVSIAIQGNVHNGLVPKLSVTAIFHPQSYQPQILGSCQRRPRA